MESLCSNEESKKSYMEVEDKKIESLSALGGDEYRVWNEEGKAIDIGTENTGYMPSLRPE